LPGLTIGPVIQSSVQELAAWSPVSNTGMTSLGLNGHR
jgi:hypothetical protein